MQSSIASPDSSSADGPLGVNSRTMKAVIHTSYGSVDGVELRDVEKPAIADHQVLVRVHASSVNPAEWYGVMGIVFARVAGGLRKPKSGAVGADLAGTIEAVGKDVTEFEPMPLLASHRLATP